MPSGTFADHGHRRARGPLSAVLIALAIAGALAAGCTSEDANPVGAMIEGPIEPADPLTIESRIFSEAGQIAVRDDSVSFDRRQLLYFGNRGGESSSFMAIYDFSSFQDTFWQDADFSESNVTVSLRLFLLSWYSDLLPEDAKGLVKTYEILELADSLDVSLYPGPEPAAGQGLATATEASGDLVQFQLPTSAFQRWLSGDHKGILVREALSTDPEEGLIGFASSDFDTLRNAGEIGLELTGTLVGPILKMEFADMDTTVILLPTADVSTMHPLAEPSASIEDGFLLRTHLRQYPYFSFDLDALPDEVKVNRAVLYFAADSTASYGPKISVVASEVPASSLVGRDTISLQELEEVAEVSGGWTSVDPRATGWIGLDISGSVQRIVNHVIDEPICWLITAGEDFTGGYDNHSYDPDFYLVKFDLAGTAVDSLRPYLQVTYSPYSSSEGGVK